MEHLKSISRSYQLLSGRSHAKFTAQIAASTGDDLQARRLHAEVYIQNGYVSADGVDHVGKMLPSADPYGHRARYFGTWLKDDHGRRAQLVATGRLIEAASGEDHSAFQSYAELQLFPEARALIEQVDAANCAEVSGLAKVRGASTAATLLLYRSMWHYSLIHGHRLWLMAIDERLYKRLQVLFGGALQPAGVATPFKGHTVIPATLNLDSSIGLLLTSTRRGPVWQRLINRRLAKFMLSGLPADIRSHRGKVV